MGKIPCSVCRKTCKGQAVRLGDKYFHVKCFKCKECQKQLSAGGFYSQNEEYYCSEDYQRLFGTKCADCGKYVEGEVITALGKTYHQNCFHCTKCNTKFGPGDKVTFNGKDYLCNRCLEAEAASGKPSAGNGPAGGMVGEPGSRSQNGLPVTSTPARAENIMLDGTLSSPASDRSDLSTDRQRTNFTNGGPLSPISISISSEGTPNKYDYSRDRYSNEYSKYMDSSMEVFDDELLTPNSQMGQRERLSPIQQIDSSSSYEGRQPPDYGRFYKTPYMKQLDETGVYRKGPSINPTSQPKSPHFHRPGSGDPGDDFSYTKVRRDFMRPIKKENSSPPQVTSPDRKQAGRAATSPGMMSALGDATQVIAKRRMEAIAPMNNEEAIRLSRFPTAQKPEGTYRMPIEREDFPAPPTAAAAYPELLRHTYRMRSRPTSDNEQDDDDDEDEENDRPIDPKIQKEIDELSKIPESGVGRVILHDLVKKRQHAPILDPRSASRTPSAKREPSYKTRYESPIFASPSRDLDYVSRPRLHSMDDNMVGSKKYRNSTLPISNFPAPKPGYGLTPKSRTLPSESRNGSYYDSGRGYESEGCYYDRQSDGRRSLYDSQSSIEEYDPETGLRRSRFRSSGLSSNFNTYLSFRRSLPSMLRTEEPPQLYPYDQLIVSDFNVPPGIDRNSLEKHLSKDEFESIFHMTHQEFYRLAEWKQNDLKKRVGLY